MIREAPVYFPPEGLVTTTNIERPEKIITVLDSLLPTLEVRSPMKIGIIGLGFDTLTICCPYEAPVIAAWLEANNLEYRLTAIDIDQTIIHDLQRRSVLFLPHSEYAKNPLVSTAWDVYLGRTVQADKFMSSMHEELILSPYYQRLRMYSTSDPLFKGIHMARVPETFDYHRRHRNMDFVCGDIANPRIQRVVHHSHDFISIMNVIYHLKTHEQQQVFQTLRTIVTPGGYVLWNDKLTSEEQQIMNKPTGWLTPERLEAEYGFVLLPIPPNSFGRNTHLMQKI